MQLKKTERVVTISVESDGSFLVQYQMEAYKLRLSPDTTLRELWEHLDTIDLTNSAREWK